MNVFVHHAALAEQMLNPFDWCPIFHSLSGSIRVVSAVVQILVGAILATYKILFSPYFSEVARGLKEGGRFTCHGILNLARGSIAMLPGVHLILFAYDKYIGRMNYEQEKPLIGVYPLLTAYKLATNKQRKYHLEV